eukprot:COSAG01_NODE_3985_length_5465_cov_3.480432_4_plen_78_part_00
MSVQLSIYRLELRCEWSLLLQYPGIAGVGDTMKAYYASLCTLKPEIATECECASERRSPPTIGSPASTSIPTPYDHR